MEANRLKQLFAEFNREREVITDRDSRVLIIDGLNMFIRSFMASPAMGDDGNHVGGTLAFMKTLFATIRKFRPTRCILVFDGLDGGRRRRKTYAGYKDGRKNKDRLNRFVRGEINEEESFRIQLENVGELLSTLPVTLITINYIEADDVIGYIVNDYYKHHNTESITIVSADRDFIQMVNGRVNVYSPTKRILYDTTKVREEFNLSPVSYLTYRILTGDDSDNIPGVKGLGLKTVIKYFPEIIESDVNPNDIIEIAKTRILEGSKLKTYQSVVDSADQISMNWELMQLDAVDIPGLRKITIDEYMDRPVEPLDKYEFKKLVHSSGLYGKVEHFDMWVQSSLSQLNIYAELR